MRRKLFTVTIKDCDLETFCTGGHGGQNQNRRKMGVRIRHRPSGATGEGREYKSQHANKKAAWRRMGESRKFQLWARAEAARRQGQKTPEEIVAITMRPENLKIEVRDERGQWVTK